MNIPDEPVLGMILKGFPRISETFISNEILLLEKLGFRIHLFSMRNPRETFCHESVKNIKAPVDYLPETLSGHPTCLLYHNFLLAVKTPRNYVGALKTALRRFMRTHKSATLKHLLQAGYLVHKYLPGSRVTHLHAHFAHSPTSVAMFASRLSGLPFSFTAHAKDIYTSDPRQLREKMSLACFVVTCTEYNRRYLKKISPDTATPIHRIYHGIDMHLFAGKSPKEHVSKPFHLLTVARLTPKKGLPTVYRALRCLKDRGLSFRHTLIGDGDDREVILSIIAELGLKPITQWLGTQPHDVVLDHYRRADLFLLGCEIARNGDRDGIPNVLLESMAIGVPVVATQISAIPELVEDGKTGLLVPPGQPEALAGAVERLLTDMELRNRVINAAREKVVRDFDNRILIRELSDIYRKCIKNA